MLTCSAGCMSVHYSSCAGCMEAYSVCLWLAWAKCTEAGFSLKICPQIFCWFVCVCLCIVEQHTVAFSQSNLIHLVGPSDCTLHNYVHGGESGFVFFMSRLKAEWSHFVDTDLFCLAAWELSGSESAHTLTYCWGELGSSYGQIVLILAMNEMTTCKVEDRSDPQKCYISCRHRFVPQVWVDKTAIEEQWVPNFCCCLCCRFLSRITYF